MDEDLREHIGELAQRHGVRPEVLEESLLSAPMPDDLSRAVAEVLAEATRFAADPGNAEK